jgi:hypothetical protein
MKNLFKALADFQQEVPVIHKGTQGYGYNYADLPTILEIINPLLKKHNLGFTQNLNSHDGVTYLCTTIFHTESGEKMDSSCEVPRITLAKMNDYQSFGSGITYFRRYCLASSLCLVTDIDTDGAGEQIKKTEVKKEPIVENKPQLSVNQFNKLFGLIQSGVEENGIVWTSKMAIEKFDLTEEQTKAIKTI